MTEVNLLTILM